mmetsp:Transcript_15229/g.39587  ORF Transcript_15229/g.39587 Transcript_15229/m.39587 type:complete len:250 (-) Transcript_15229:137-886(-)
MSDRIRIRHILPLSESFASLVRPFIAAPICVRADSVFSSISSSSLSCTLSSVLISWPMSLSLVTELEMTSSCESCSFMMNCCFWASSAMKRELSACAAVSTFMLVSLLVPASAAALSPARSDSLSVPSFFTARLLADVVDLLLVSPASAPFTSARIVAMLERVPSTNCFLDSISSSLSPNFSRLPWTMPIVSSRSCRSHSMERRPESSSDLVHSYSSVSVPAADLYISFHRLCSSFTTLRECCTSSLTT